MKLDQSLKTISDIFNWQVVIGLELEFYLEHVDDKNLTTFFANFLREFPMCILEKEKGYNQFEIKIHHTPDIYGLISTTNKIKEYLLRQSLKADMKANFLSKPYKDEPGSSLHVNISFYEQKNNIYAKNGSTESNYLLYSIGGLCKHMLNHLNIFLPSQNDYARIVPKQNSPTTVSWGGNNRTVAIRVPTTDPLNRRIEHRVPSANADPHKVIEAILFAILDGIKNKILPPAKIYGDASMQTYALTPLI